MAISVISVNGWHELFKLHSYRCNIDLIDLGIFGALNKHWRWSAVMVEAMRHVCWQVCASTYSP